MPASNRLAPQWLLFSVIVVDLTGFGIVIPILPFISPALGGDEFDVALVIAVYSLCAGIVGPYWGGLSDRIGRKKVLMLCLGGGALSYVLLGMATELWMVYVARSFAGLMAGSLPVASALMADLSTPERRAKAMGLVGTAFGIGLILGPFLGGLLAGDGQSFAGAGLFAGTMSLLSVGLAAVLLENDHPGDDGHRAVSTVGGPRALLTFVRGRGALGLVALYSLHTFAVSAVIYLSPLWLAAFLDWGPREVGILFGLVGLAMILIQGVFLDWLTTRFGLIRVLSSGAVVFALSLFAALIASGDLQRPFVILTAFAGATCVLPVLNTIASSLVAEDERGRMMGITALSSAVGRVTGPLLAGVALALAGYSVTWLIIALPVVGVWWWSVRVGDRYDRAADIEPS